MAVQVVRMPWGVGYRVSDCEVTTGEGECQINDAGSHSSRADEGVTYWPRGQSGPRGQKPVR